VAGNLMLRLCDRYSFPDKDFGSVIGRG
jgi:hypothetical protein